MGVGVDERGALFFPANGLTVSPSDRLCSQGSLSLGGSPRKGRARASPSSGPENQGLNCVPRTLKLL